MEKQHLNVNAISHYRATYFKSSDCIVNAIEDRFDQEDFRTYVKLENLLLKEAKGDTFFQEYKYVIAAI